MAKTIDGKVMIPGTFTNKKAVPVWHMPATRFLFGEQAIQGEQQWFMKVNLFAKAMYGYYSEPIPYSIMERVEYGDGKAAKNTLKIITNEVNGSYYLCVSEWCEPQIAKVKELLEACIEEGCYGAKAEAIAASFSEPMEKVYNSHLTVAIVCFVLAAVIGWEFSLLLSIIPALISYYNARTTRIPALRWIPLLLIVFYLYLGYFVL